MTVEILFANMVNATNIHRNHLLGFAFYFLKTYMLLLMYYNRVIYMFPSPVFPPLINYHTNNSAG